jgi:hypothetical protein
MTKVGYILGFLAAEEPAIEAFETAHPARVQTV